MEAKKGSTILAKAVGVNIPTSVTIRIWKGWAYVGCVVEVRNNCFSLRVPTGFRMVVRTTSSGAETGDWL